MAKELKNSVYESRTVYVAYHKEWLSLVLILS